MVVFKHLEIQAQVLGAHLIPQPSAHLSKLLFWLEVRAFSSPLAVSSPFAEVYENTEYQKTGCVKAKKI